MWQDKRSSESEILDLGENYYTPEEYDSCLRILSRINTLLGGFSAIKSAMKKIEAPHSILEVGCGGGYLCQHLHEWFPDANVTGIDINPRAIEHANANLPKKISNKVSFHLQNGKTLEYPPGSFDVVVAMLVCHHMTDDELIVFLKDSYRVASSYVIINDLQRHVLAYLSFSLIAPLCFRNRLVCNDGPLSIKRSFRKKEWITLLEKAGFNKSQYTLKWNWAFRYTLTLRKT